jgi:hypothetical protein
MIRPIWIGGPAAVDAAGLEAADPPGLAGASLAAGALEAGALVAAGALGDGVAADEHADAIRVSRTGREAHLLPREDM